MNKNILNLILILSFGIFGLTALIYQVAFVKNLMLLFGLTAPAIATVLAVYFSGLALGSFIFGKLADRLTKTFKQYLLYIGLFAGAGIYGFLTPYLFGFLGKIIHWINQIYPLHFSGFNFFAFLLSFLFLIIPAILIGGGFSIISKILVRESETLGKKISLIYFINTFGGVIGALLAGFWLIPVFGVKIALFSASGLILTTIGLLGLAYSRILWRSDLHNIQGGKGDSVATFKNKIFIYALFITGFLALALEVFYTKTLILFFGSSTYAFSLILIIFLLGIALGSLIISRFLDHLKRGFFFFGLFCGLLGFWLFITIKLFEKIPFFYLKIFQLLKSSDFSIMLFAQSLILILIIFPATLLMGMIFPLGIKLANPNNQKIGEGAGKLYFANTLGGVFGSLTAGFFLLPALGFQKSLIFVLTFYILLAIFFLIKEKEIKFWLKRLSIDFFLIVIFLAIFSSSWSKPILSAGIFFNLPKYFEKSEREIKTDWQKNEILFYKEGLSQVAVFKKNETLWLSVNGKVEASNKTDLETEILSGALPLILHKNPKEVLIIGLGSGITLGAATQFDEVEKIDLVEIDPAVVSAAGFFKEENHDALSDKRVKTILSDARNYLYLNEKKYDVISSAPSNPWISGNSYLFTKEFYELCKNHLKENGLMFQWIQYYNFSPQDLKVILKTFNRVFPKTYLFTSLSTNDLLLVGVQSENSILDFSNIENKLQDKKIQKELERIHIKNPYELLARFIASDLPIREITKNTKIHQDDRPFLEFSAPKYLYENTANPNLEILVDLNEKEKSLPKFLEGNEEQRISKTFNFMENWIFSQVAILNNDLEGALFFTENAYKTEIYHPLLFQNLKNLYSHKIQILEEEGKTEEAQEFLEKANQIQ